MTMSIPLKVCVVTASRSEYGLMRWIIRDLADDPAFSLSLIVTGAHLSARHGHTVDEVRAGGHEIAAEIPVDLSDDSPLCLAQASAGITHGVAKELVHLQPDIALVLGDRWEMLAVAAACALTTTPLGHFSGGELTEGAIDDSIRHALTKLSHLHFVANEAYADRVRQLGEEDWRIDVCGGPGLDNFSRLPLMNPAELGSDLGIDLSRPTAVVTLHPATTSLDQVERLALALAGALQTAHQRFGLRYVITGPCADPGADRIEQVLRKFVAETQAGIYVPSLGQIRYLSLLKAARVMIGNSSSAFHEAPLAGLCAVNVGDRQKGRLSGGNVITVDTTHEAILEGIAQAIRRDTDQAFSSPYGDGSASPRVRKFLLNVFDGRSRIDILRKKFVDWSRG